MNKLQGPLWITVVLLLTSSVALLVRAGDLGADDDDDPGPSGPDGLRAGATLYQDLPAPVIPREIRAMPRPKRSYPEQPPVIPHSIRDYQIDINFNTCMTCHSRTQSPRTGSIAASVTHYYNRAGQPLGAVSPRRYFCLQCHVSQHEIDRAVESTFRDMEQLIIEEASQRRGRN
ncbi:MAG: cytochrome C [Chromatiaceae bacterium]|nr:MAG: cytochrome C [Chromatiaceae bacterium]